MIMIGEVGAKTELFCAKETKGLGPILVLRLFNDTLATHTHTQTHTHTHPQ